MPFEELEAAVEQAMAHTGAFFFKPRVLGFFRLESLNYTGIVLTLAIDQHPDRRLGVVISLDRYESGDAESLILNVRDDLMELVDAEDSELWTRSPCRDDGFIWTSLD
jgi:hypothetical protein